MSEWPFATLEQLCAEGGGFIKTGPFGSQLHRSDYIDDPDGIPVVMPKNMLDGRIDLADIARIGVDTADRLSQHLLSENDVVLSRRGDVGRSVWIEQRDLPAFCGTGSMRVHLGSPVSIHPEYLRYFFRSKLSSDYLEAHAVGATMPNLNTTIVGSLPVPVPPLDVQIAVSRLLSLFDDLVENNRRRIELLESMARAIYREWFVHFRFPGHEDVPLADSDLGPIPEGWRVSVLNDVVECTGGSTVTKAAYINAGFRAFSASGPDGFLPDYEVDGKGVVLSAVGARCGRTFKASGRWSSIANTIKLLPRNGLASVSWLYLVTENPEIWPKRGSAQPFVSINDARNLKVTLAPENILKLFECRVGPLFDLAHRLEDVSDRLQCQRDLLLPKLVSGEIDVSGLDLAS